MRPEEIEHPGLRRLLEGLYALLAEGEPPTLDQLRGRLDNPRWRNRLSNCRKSAGAIPTARPGCGSSSSTFAERRLPSPKQELHNQLHAAGDHAAALELLRQLTKPKVVEGGLTPAPLYPALRCRSTGS